MQSKRLSEISLIKTFMMLTIVFYHSCMFFTGKWFTYMQPIYSISYIDYLTDWLNSFHIHAFVMASGFLYYHFLNVNKESSKNKIYQRGKRLLLPYLFVSLFWVIPINTYFFNLNLNEIIQKFVLCDYPAQLWFLVMLFNIYVLFELFLKKVEISNKNFTIIFIVTMLIYLFTRYINCNYFQISNMSKFLIFFYLGAYLEKYKDKFSFKKCLILLFIYCLLFIVLFFLKDRSVDKIIYSINIQIMSLISVTLIYLLCNYIINIKKIKFDGNFYKLLEKNSFGIYLFHQQIIYFTIILFNGKVLSYIQILLSFVIALTLSLALSLLLKKNKITKTLFGL